MQSNAARSDRHPTASSASPTSPDRLPSRGCRREESRAPHRLPCRVRVFDAVENDWIAKLGQTVNMSAGGLAVQVGLAVPPGTRIEALFPRFEEPPLCVSGTVRHSRRVLAGTFELGIETAGGRVVSLDDEPADD